MQTPARNKIINAWCMYDWANSAFATTVMAAILPIFFGKVAAAEFSPELATSIWGYITAISMLLVAVLSLILGPVSDFSSSRKKFLAAFAGIGILSTSVLVFTGAGDWVMVGILFILGNIGFAGSEVFYDSFLPHIAKPDEINRISTKGYALGYMGGGILLAINIVMILFLPETVVSPDNESISVLGMQLSFLTVGIWWGLFSIPILRRVPEPMGVQIGLGGQNPLRIAHRRLSATLRDIRKYRQLFLFIISFWFYNDGIGTIIKMATIYGGEIGIGVIHLVGALMLTQIIGIPLSLAFGRVADRIGAKRSILIGLGVYLIISIGGYFMTHAIHFWILACLVGLVQGGTQALSRSLFSSMVPRNKSAEFFSFYNISGKFAGIMGPAIFAIVGQLAGSSRLGILSLVFFFLIGGYLLINVDVEEGKRMATNWEQNG